MNLLPELFLAAAAPAVAELPASSSGGINLIHGFLLGALAIAAVLFAFDSRRYFISTIEARKMIPPPVFLPFRCWDLDMAEFLSEIIPPMAGLKEVVG